MYTKVTCEIEFPERDKVSYAITDSKWDLSMEEFFEHLRTLSLSVGYNPQIVEEYFG